MLTTTTGFAEAARLSALPLSPALLPEQAAQQQAHKRRNTNLKPKTQRETLTFALPPGKRLC
jgi:hypothetical protein